MEIVYVFPPDNETLSVEDAALPPVGSVVVVTGPNRDAVSYCVDRIEVELTVSHRAGQTTYVYLHEEVK